MQCFDTFCRFPHKLYAATMDSKGREGTYNYFSRRLGGQPGGRAQGQLPPCHPAGAVHVTAVLRIMGAGIKLTVVRHYRCLCWSYSTVRTARVRFWPKERSLVLASCSDYIVIVIGDLPTFITDEWWCFCWTKSVGMRKRKHKHWRTQSGE